MADDIVVWSSALARTFRFIHGGQRDGGVRVGASRPHLRRNPDCLHQLLARGVVTECRFRVSSDAIGALRNVCYRNSDQLLGLRRKRAVSKDLPTESLKGFLRVGSESPPLL